MRLTPLQPFSVRESVLSPAFLYFLRLSFLSPIFVSSHPDASRSFLQIQQDHSVDETHRMSRSQHFKHPVQSNQEANAAVDEEESAASVLRMLTVSNQSQPSTKKCTDTEELRFCSGNLSKAAITGNGSESMKVSAMDLNSPSGKEFPLSCNIQGLRWCWCLFHNLLFKSFSSPQLRERQIGSEETDLSAM